MPPFIQVIVDSYRTSDWKYQNHLQSTVTTTSTFWQNPLNTTSNIYRLHPRDANAIPAFCPLDPIAVSTCGTDPITRIFQTILILPETTDYRLFPVYQYMLPVDEAWYYSLGPNALPPTIRGLAIRWIGPPARARENRLLAPRTVSVGDFIYIPCSLTSTVVASALTLGALWSVFFLQCA
ncbi:unnamed protein product [Penicillium pancosmium]